MHKRNGFTIVELLIVIVVVGILAAITMVAFSDIRQRSRNAQIISGVDAYEKAFLQYGLINRAYPSGATSNLCLGSGYTGPCVSGPAVGGQTINPNDASFDTQVATIMQGKPRIGGDIVDVGGGTMVVGAYYWNLQIFYHLYGNGRACAAGGTGSNFGSLTRCTLVLPNPTQL